MMLLICVKVTLVIFETLEKVVPARIGKKRKEKKTELKPKD